MAEDITAIEIGFSVIPDDGRQITFRTWVARDISDPELDRLLDKMHDATERFVHKSAANKLKYIIEKKANDQEETWIQADLTTKKINELQHTLMTLPDRTSKVEAKALEAQIEQLQAQLTNFKTNTDLFDRELRRLTTQREVHLDQTYPRAAVLYPNERNAQGELIED